jgi:hypothetical protein
MKENAMRFLTTAIGTIGCVGILLAGAGAWAGECTGGECGTPDQSGGGCGCSCGSILVAMTDRGETYQFGDDFDGDGIEDAYDSCPYHSNYEQTDADTDGVGDACDLCPGANDPDQMDYDSDGMGDACDADIDGDLVANLDDNCPFTSNSSQNDNDGDGAPSIGGGDACDTDDDNDGTPDSTDGCRLEPGDVGDTCDDDPDGDGVPSAIDNCAEIQQDEFGDIDADGLGDDCDTDMDGDLVPNFRDNCDGMANPTQVDMDGDGLGDNGQWGTGFPGSCDPSECYVVPGEPIGNCLNPTDPFRIGLVEVGLPRAGEFKVGDMIRIPILTNRLRQVHSWTARLDKLPDASEAWLHNARGSASTWGQTNRVSNCLRQSSGGGCAEYNYISFEPDAPGEYVIKVSAELPAGDPLNINAATRAAITIKVGGQAEDGGCNDATGASGGLAALAVGLFATSTLRRRRN